MRRWIEAMILAMALAGAGACAKAEEPGTPSGEQAQAGQAEEKTPAEARIADEDLPVEADFEEEAAREITADNYLSELDSLDQEIAAGD